MSDISDCINEVEDKLKTQVFFQDHKTADEAYIELSMRYIPVNVELYWQSEEVLMELVKVENNVATYRKIQ